MSFLSDIFFPNRCLCCQEFSSALLCAKCIPCLPRRKKWQCPKCQKKTTPLGSTCVACFGTTSLNGIFSATHYKHPTVTRVITAYKYGFSQSLARPLGMFLANTIKENDLPLPDIILSVPLHPRRLRWRGFNQSSLLADIIARKLLPQFPLKVLHTTLKRKRYTPPQAKTDNRKPRFKNLQGAFIFSGSIPAIRDKHIWLVDDVATTGATLTECARVLKRAGAKEVWGIVIAS